MRRELPLVSRLRRGVASIALGWGIGCALAVAPVVEARDVEGLVVYFPFDEGAGGSVTDPRGGHEGSIIGDAVWGKGKYGGGLDFGGEDGYVRVPHHGDFDFTEGITIAVWIRPTLAVGPGIWQILAAKGQDASEFFEILINPAGLVWMGGCCRTRGSFPTRARSRSSRRSGSTSPFRTRRASGGTCI